METKLFDVWFNLNIFHFKLYLKSNSLLHQEYLLFVFYFIFYFWVGKKLKYNKMIYKLYVAKIKLYKVLIIILVGFWALKFRTLYSILTIYKMYKYNIVIIKMQNILILLRYIKWFSLSQARQYLCTIEPRLSIPRFTVFLG